MREIWGRDHASVGMRKPSGEYERPIPGTRLFWTKPGTSAMYSYFTTSQHRIRYIKAVMHFNCILFEENLQQEKDRGGN